MNLEAALHPEQSGEQVNRPRTGHQHDSRAPGGPGQDPFGLVPCLGEYRDGLQQDSLRLREAATASPCRSEAGGCPTMTRVASRRRTFTRSRP